MLDYKELTKEVCAAVMEAGNFIKQEGKNFDRAVVEEKGKASLVSYVDKNAEQILVDKLSVLLPDAGFIAEEGTSTKKGDRYNWIIDPLDGTTNFIHGLAPHSVSVALQEDNELVIGVVLEVTQFELFYTWKGAKSYCNDREISVSTATKEEDTLIATGLPYYNFDQMDNYMQVLTHFMRTTRGVRRMGSAAVDLAYVASGKFDGFFEHALHAWDVAAGVLLVKNAGGVVSDFSGGENVLFGGEMVAASSSFYSPLFTVVNRYLGK